MPFRPNDGHLMMPRVWPDRLPPAGVLKREAATLARFVLVGLSNTLVGLGVVYLCWRGFGWPDLAANPAGFAVALVWSYALNRRITFRSAVDHRRAFVPFVLVSGGAYLCSLLALLLARHWLGQHTFLPHLIANAVYSGLAFLAYRLVVFADRHPPG